MTTENKVGTTVTTEDLIKAVAEASKVSEEDSFSQREVRIVLSLLKKVVANALAAGQRISWTGFLCLTPSYRAARKGNNVVTSEKMDIPESVVVSVKAGKLLKDAVKSMDASMIEAIHQICNKENAE